MLILCYEVEYLDGEVRARDDAGDVRFFPIKDIPELAFKPNERAIEKYLELYRNLQ